jgi:putrescine:ornithine antiporter
MQQKKMNLTQLTFIVAVNMMGSGIIMLPTNMAQVGAISLLSWAVTAVGSLALAYAFAQAGLFNQRAGGMAAYAEDAYGKDGYFQVFFLYFLSLAIANVAVASSAVGYLSAFFPWLSSTPVATTIGVIALLWLTTVANFGGPGVTGRIGAVTVWGVILPVGLISIIGWFWFSGTTFAAAWNPKGLTLVEGMGSSISLTLWAFLGLESAAQAAGAVEDPKRTVPLACMFGTVGAAVIYILSTTVIQGIVPNADLAKSTGPFGLVYARMFSPAVGSLVMVLAVMACLGSLLGWQFTLAQTGKSAADEGMFPSLFSKTNTLGAPIAGMVVMGVVQSAMALSTISPNLSEQFSALVNLAVVTNVVPYLIALSALPVMMRAATVDAATYRRNVVIAVVAMVYSVYAIYTSGKDAVFGGMLVWALSFVIWAFIGYRFTSMTRIRTAAATLLVMFGAAAILEAQGGVAATPATAQSSETLQRVRETGHLRLGYRTDARPFSYRDPSGQTAGYSVELCRRVVDAVKRETRLEALAVDWVAVGADDRLGPVQRGQIDLLCGAETVTLARRAATSFSIPIFPGGIGALVRADAPARLREVLAGHAQTYRPTWRAAATRVLQSRSFAAVRGTTSEKWLTDRLNDLEVIATVAPVTSYDGGIQALLDHRSDAFFGDRAILLDAAKRHASARDLTPVDRLFTYEPVALALARDDETFRLLVDRALSRFYDSGSLGALYATWFGEPDESALAFFRWNTLPE